MTRLILLFTLLILIFNDSLSQDRPLVGAIRWDAWIGQSDYIGAQVNVTLGPNHWHYRLPFYTTVIDSNTVDIDGTSQETVDKEIEYAAYGQIDYFAFLMYDNNSTLSNGLHKFLSSTKKDMINFCVILNYIWSEPITTSVERILDYFQESNYQCVLGNRPLVFAYELDGSPEMALELKDSCASRGWPEPYIVSLQYADHMPSNNVYDAISRYWYGPNYGGLEAGAPYSNLMNAAKLDWEIRKDNGAKQVLLVSTGGDGRPRIENPVSWIDDPSAYERYFETPTPQQITTHLGQAFNFIENNPSTCEVKLVLMYAWNENDEGGWLVPTLENDIDTNTSRIDSLRSFLLNYLSGSTSPTEPDIIKLPGNVLGSSDPGNTDHLADKAFDGILDTYTELKEAPRYVGLEFEKECKLSHIRFLPRFGYQTRMDNGSFQVSTDSSNWLDIHTITNTPPDHMWTEIILEPTVNAKYARFSNPYNYLTVAEIEFYVNTEDYNLIVDLEIEKITLYPNPTNEHITISIKEPINLLIYNSIGVVLYEEKLTKSKTISLKEFHSGIYFFKFSDNKNIIIKNIIKE
ncbi:MAG: T9SS type A sorting domain-containing protein [Bacteroidales bacterium]|nr:T9SS type A sorting domain-containing protein [Bacteroidales bacterium]